MARKALALGGELCQSSAMVLRGFALALMLMVPAAEAEAEAIRRACLKSDRGGGQARLCRCIQGVADRALSRRDQKRVSRFFRDPDEAQRARRSDRRRDEVFWDRYARFGALAEKSCTQ
ncbi:MAG: hypothetical protein OIF48_00340 [Silicimonas sp.]|nr:hypothetical protein [Silicimonas sp.]